MPTGRSNQMRGEGIYLHGEPIRRGERVYTYRADQSDEGRVMGGRYDARFLGMLEAEADGVGVWAAAEDLTIVAGVCAATFAPFAGVCGGEALNVHPISTRLPLAST